MKVLKKKLKKVNKVKRFFYKFIQILYLATYIYFVYGLLKLSSIETGIRIGAIIFFGIWFIIYSLAGLVTMLTKKNKAFVILAIITFIFCPLFAGSSFVINKGYGSLSSMNKNQITYTTNLITLKETNWASYLKLGMIENENDIEGNVLAKKLIEKENIKNKVEMYEDYNSMIADLYKGEIGGCFVPADYAIVFANEEFEILEEGQEKTPIEERVKVVKEYSEKMENQDNQALKASKEKTLTEPFTVLIMGVDSTIDGLTKNQAFNGDTLIMATFNPNTLTATMFSIPRDLYVPIACNHDKYNKINSSAAYGSSCVINTVQKLTGIDIDYYAKMNFTGVVQLVEAVGGVEVEVEEPDFNYDKEHAGMMCEQDSKRRKGSSLICIKPGFQKLNGEQALAYARCRHLYALSDISRNQHQQAIIEALAKKLKTIKTLKEFQSIVDAVSNNLETNITPEQIMSFYNVGKDMLATSQGSQLSIKKTYLSYYSLPVWLSGPGMYTSALGYYPESLDAIVKLMKVNLELETQETTKTFSISYNEDYTTPIVGKGLTGGTKLERVQSFVGSSRSAAQAWCSSVGLSCSFETRQDSADEGIIVDQSKHSGVLVKSITSMTFYVSDGSGGQKQETTNNCPANQVLGDGKSCVCKSGYSRATPTDPCVKKETTITCGANEILKGSNCDCVDGYEKNTSGVCEQKKSEEPVQPEQPETPEQPTEGTGSTEN